MNWYYYDNAGRKQGPVDEAQLRALASLNTINHNTRLESETGDTKLAGQLDGLFSNPSSPASDNTVPNSMLEKNNGDNCDQFVKTSSKQSNDSRSINSRRINIGFALIFVFYIVGIIALLASIFSRKESWLYVGVFGCAGGAICVLAVLYWLWSQVPSCYASTKPGNAVKFLFIPIFNIIWVFIAYYGLSKSLNKTLENEGSNQRVSERLVLIVCILTAVILGLRTLAAFNPEAVNMPASLLILLFSLRTLLFIFALNSLRKGAVALKD